MQAFAPLSLFVLIGLSLISHESLAFNPVQLKVSTCQEYIPPPPVSSSSPGEAVWTKEGSLDHDDHDPEPLAPGDVIKHNHFKVDSTPQQQQQQQPTSPGGKSGEAVASGDTTQQVATLSHWYHIRAGTGKLKGSTLFIQAEKKRHHQKGREENRKFRVSFVDNTNKVLKSYWISTNEKCTTTSSFNAAEIDRIEVHSTLPQVYTQRP